MEDVQQGFTLIDWLVIAAYMALMVLIGILSSRKQEDAETFFLGGRAMPTWAVTLSVLATALSAATFIGVPQLSYDGDLTYLILNIGGVLAAFVVAFVLIPPIYRAGTITIYGYLGQRFGQGASVAASVMFLAGRLLASGARLFMAGIAFSLMLYGDTSKEQLVLALLILGLVGTLYTVCGGIRAVIWTDTIQIGVVVFAGILSIYVLLEAIPLPVSDLVDVLRNSSSGNKLRVVDTRLDLGLSYTLLSGIVASTFVSTACFGTDHDLAQRLMTAKSSFRGGLAIIASNILTIPVVILFLCIGLLLHVYYGRPDLMGAAAPLDGVVGTERVYPQFLLNHLPVGVRGLAMSGMFAAAMSSFDSAINAMASTAIADIYTPLLSRRGVKGEGATHGLKAPRLAVVMMGVLLTAFAVLALFLYVPGKQGLVGFALGVMAFALAPLLGVYLTAILTKRGNTPSVVAGLFVGALTVLLLQPYALPARCDFALGWPWIWVVATPVSFVVCVLGAPAKSRASGTTN